MNYPESKKILAEIKKAKRILLGCHRGPDPDSIGSVLAMYEVLKGLDKNVMVVCSSEELSDRVSFLSSYSKIKKGVDFSKFDYSKFDLFITLDSSSWGMVTGDKEIAIPGIPLAVIDHHRTNPRYGTINLVDVNSTSVGEILYRVFQDWGVNLDKVIATDLLTGIIGDTGAFRFPGSTEKTFKIAGRLMELGADKDNIIFNIYRSSSFNLIKFYGEVLSGLNFDSKGKFVWAAVPYDKYKKFGKPSSAKESTASLFAQVVEGTDFGLIAVETEKDTLAVSFRSRTGFDTSEIATALGGGGHVYASACTIEGLPFDEAVKKVLTVARKYAKKGKK